MPVPNTKVFLASAAQGSGGYRLLPQETGDFAYAATGAVTAPWVSGIADLNGDGIGELVTAVPGSNDQAVGAGRIYVTLGTGAGGAPSTLDSLTAWLVIDGAGVNDHAGSALAGRRRSGPARRSSTGPAMSMSAPPTWSGAPPLRATRSASTISTPVAPARASRSAARRRATMPARRWPPSPT
jgi:hypothetical protein